MCYMYLDIMYAVYIYCIHNVGDTERDGERDGGEKERGREREREREGERERGRERVGDTELHLIERMQPIPPPPAAG